MPSHSLAIPDPKRPILRAAEPADGGALEGECALDFRFACPVCSSALRVSRENRISVGTCPVCQSGVVAPQPQFGCRAMPYRDWLKLQEMDPLALEAPPAPTQPQLATPKPRRPRTRRRRSLRWAAGLVAPLLAAGVWMVARPTPASFPSTSPTPPGGVVADPPVSPATSASTEASSNTAKSSIAAPPPGPLAAASAGVDPVSTESPPPPARLSPLASVLARQADSPASVVVRASRRHDFSRSAPGAEDALCLRLSDPADDSVTTRAYVRLADPFAGPVQELLPWGQEARVRVQLEWQPPDEATHLSGHWRVTSLEWAPDYPGVAAATPP